MAQIQNPDGGGSTYVPPNTNTTGGQSQSPPASTPPPIDNSSSTLAEQVAANLAALGYTGSPLGGTSSQAPVIVQAGSNNMVWILVILGIAVLGYFYMKKHGNVG